MKIRLVALGFILLLVQACSDSTSPPAPSRIVVTPNTVTLEALGETQQFSARVEDKSGREMTDVAVTWSSSDMTVASVTSSGVATGLKAGSASIRATTEGLSGQATLTVSPVPRELTKVSGDTQVGGIQHPLPLAPTVEVQDSRGNPLEGINVSFTVLAGAGTVSDGLVRTGADGKASTQWQLGCSNETPQRLEANASGLRVEFTATADLSVLAICPGGLPDGRETHQYAHLLTAAGGDQGTLTWSAVPGGLPAGLSLDAGGRIFGTPSLAGLFVFEARAQDALGNSASRQFPLRVCEAPLSLTPGQTLSLAPSGSAGCGFFLPSGSSGDRYRLAVVYASSIPDSLDVPTVTVTMSEKTGVTGSPGMSMASASDRLGGLVPSEYRQEAAILDPTLLEALEVTEATEAFHHRLRLAERELIRNLGPEARPLPDRGRTELLAASPERAASPDKMTFTHPKDYSKCDLGSTVRALKIAENDLMVIYQDSTQHASTPVSGTHAEWMLDYYQRYGKPVIDQYFDGVSDINGDGKVVVLVTPEVQEQENVAAFVWTGDFYPKAAQDGWPGCLASNQMELVRFNLSTIQGMSSNNYQALSTLVHEVKHVSSLYKGLIRGDALGGFHPLWVEEGRAEIAGEMSSRLAWEATGGPAVNEMAEAGHVVGSSFTRENYGVIRRMARTVQYLSSQPNGVVVTPSGAHHAHSVYGSGWHFHRWLGDAYGTSSVRLGDSGIFRSLNDSLTLAGVPGIRAVTGGKAWVDLMEEYAVAIMRNGTPAPLGPRSFTTYNFPSMNKTFNYTGKPSGDYPWPVNVFGSNTSAPFGSSTNTGLVGPSGIRVFDLTSAGAGLGVEVKVDASRSPVRVVVLRVQ
jgi:hypothetical protein